MAIKLRVVNHGSDAPAIPPLQAPRGGLTNVEVRDAGRMVVEGVSLDLRGARSPATVRYDKAEPLDSVVPHVSLSRLANGDYEHLVVTTLASAVSSDQALTLQQNQLPFRVAGTAGETIASTAPGSIGYTAGARILLRAVHNQGIAWGEGLDAQGRFAKSEKVAAGHDWLLGGIHQAAFLLAHNTSVAWEAFAKWCEQVVQGAVDISNVTEWYADDGASMAPAAPKTWYDWANGSRKTLAAAVSVPGTPPTAAQLAGGAWIETFDWENRGA